ncbi:MAG: DNA translocase FtsK 4TM domain-containing protein [Alphaproteobacteria bacterium]|nr:DNA translocase FtsK 4TM domain-containing protein [Alphaproteobacteria bacterium]
MTTIRTSKRRPQQQSFTELFREKLQIFLARRVIDTLALCSALIAGFLALSLISYTSADPSWNTAVIGERIHNWMGTRGAVTADILLQTLGGAAFILPLSFGVWAFRLFTRQSIRPFALRLAALLLAGITLSIGMGQISSFGGLNHPYLGGAGGTVLLNEIGKMLAAFEINISLPLVSFVAGLTGTLSLLFALSIGFPAVKASFYRLLGLTATGLRGARYGAGRFSGWVQRYNEPALFSPEDEREEQQAGREISVPAKPQSSRRKAPTVAGNSPIDSPESESPAPLVAAIKAPEMQETKASTKNRQPHPLVKHRHKRSLPCKARGNGFSRLSTCYRKPKHKWLRLWMKMLYAATPSFCKTYWLISKWMVLSAKSAPARL